MAIKKIFISGPIDGVPARRLKRFDELKEYFESNGGEIITEFDVPYPELEEDAEKLVDKCNKETDLVSWLIISMKKIWAMAQCDALFLLPGWQECHLSVMLFVAARKLDMPAYIDDGSAIKLANEDELRNWFEKEMEGF